MQIFDTRVDFLSLYKNILLFLNLFVLISNNISKCSTKIFNDKVFFFPTVSKYFGQYFNFRILVKLFIREVKKT